MDVPYLIILEQELEFCKQWKKIGEPGEFLGQNALGDLTGLDQRNLNIMYCENAKANLITNELAKPLSHTLGEYEDVSSGNYAKALTRKLKKIYCAYRFSIAVFGETITPTAYSYKGNGNCLPTANSQISDHGKSLVVCWTQEDSFAEAANTVNPTQLGNLLKETLNDQIVRVL